MKLIYVILLLFPFVILYFMTVIPSEQHYEECQSFLKENPNVTICSMVDCNEVIIEGKLWYSWKTFFTFIISFLVLMTGVWIGVNKRFIEEVEK